MPAVAPGMGPGVVAHVVASPDQPVDQPKIDQPKIGPPRAAQPEVGHPKVAEPEIDQPEAVPVAVAQATNDDGVWQPSLRTSTSQAGLQPVLAEPAQRRGFTLTYEPEKRFRFPRWASRALLVAGVLLLGGFSLTAFMLRLGVSDEEKAPKISPAPAPQPAPSAGTTTTVVTPDTGSAPLQAALPAPLQPPTTPQIRRIWPWAR